MSATLDAGPVARAQHPAIERVILVCFDDETYEATQSACAASSPTGPSASISGQKVMPSP